MKFCEQLSLYLVIAMRTRSKLKRLKELLNHAKWAAPHVMLCLARNAQKLLLVADHSTVQFLLWKHLHFRCQAIHELPKTSITKLNAVLKKTNEKEELHRCSVRDASFTWCQARVFFSNWRLLWDMGRAPFCTSPLVPFVAVFLSCSSTFTRNNSALQCQV